MRHWYHIKTADDAPLSYEGDEAKAWADGYNAAVEACTEESNALMRDAGRGQRGKAGWASPNSERS